MSKTYNPKDFGLDDTSNVVPIKPKSSIGEAADSVDLSRFTERTRDLINPPFDDDVDSERRMSAIRALFREGATPEEVIGILIDPDNKISQRRNAGKSIDEKFARREVEKAMTSTPNPADDFSEPVDPKWLRTDAESKAKVAKKKPTIKFQPFELPDHRKIPVRPWLYPPIYIRKKLTLTTAQGGVGKSSLVLVEFVAMASGRNLLGVEVPEPLRCVYWNGEDDLEELTRRVAAICLHYGISKSDLGDRLSLHSGRTLPIVLASSSRDGFKMFEPVANEFVAALRDFKADVFTIDPFVTSHAVSENEATAMGAVAYKWADIGDRANVAAGIVHHNRKPPGGMGGVATIDDARGSTALINAARVRRALNPMTEVQAKAAAIDPAKRHFYFSADTSRSNLQPPASALQWYRMESVDLQNGDFPQISDLMGVPAAYKYVAIPEVQTTPHEDERIITALAKRDRWRANPRSDDWIGHEIGRQLGHHDLKGKANEQQRKQVNRIVADLVKAGTLVAFTDKDEARHERDFYRCDSATVAAPVTVAD